MTPAIGRRTLLGATAATLAMPAVLRAQTDTIKVGFPVPLTGPIWRRSAGPGALRPTRHRRVQRRRRANGQKAELLVRDDKLDPGEAATRTLELIEKDGAADDRGSLSASVQLAVNSVTRERKVLYNSISQSDQIAALPD